jgi:hypothetical protein
MSNPNFEIFINVLLVLAIVVVGLFLLIMIMNNPTTPQRRNRPVSATPNQRGTDEWMRIRDDNDDVYWLLPSDCALELADEYARRNGGRIVDGGREWGRDSFGGRDSGPRRRGQWMFNNADEGMGGVPEYDATPTYRRRTRLSDDDALERDIFTLSINSSSMDGCVVATGPVQVMNTTNAVYREPLSQLYFPPPQLYPVSEARYTYLRATPRNTYPRAADPYPRAADPYPRATNPDPAWRDRGGWRSAFSEAILAERRWAERGPFTDINPNPMAPVDLPTPNTAARDWIRTRRRNAAVEQRQADRVSFMDRNPNPMAPMDPPASNQATRDCLGNRRSHAAVGNIDMNQQQIPAAVDPPVTPGWGLMSESDNTAV